MIAKYRLPLLGAGLVTGVAVGYINRSPLSDVQSDAIAQPSRVSPTSRPSTTPKQHPRHKPSPYLADRIGVHTLGSADDPMNPLSPTYDSIFTHQASGRSIGDVFEDEPIDKPWAEEMSEITGTHFESEAQLLGAEIEVEAIECRTGTCKVVLAGLDDELSKLNGPWLSSFSEMTTLSSGPEIDDGQSRYYLYLAFSNDRRDPDAHQRWHTRHRQELIDLLRKRGTLPEGIGDE